MNWKEFFKFNKFKMVFSAAFIVITFLALLIGDALHSEILSTVFAILYFPALFFAWNFQFLPIFERCWISFGEEICSHDSTIALILSIPIFIVYVYTVSCLIYFICNKFKNRCKK